MLHVLQWAIHVCSKCFNCFRRLLQVFHLDVAKLDRDVAYIYVSVLGIFHTYVASVLP
jgi:hypothetical protein